MTSRSDIRKKIRKSRNALTDQQRLDASEMVCDHLVSTRQFINSKRIAFYYPNDGEIDLFPVIDRALAMKKKCYFPVLDHMSEKKLWFVPFNHATSFTLNQYNIPEPNCLSRHYTRAWMLDLILMPLVAFDIQGNRLGMGGGYYDRTLEFLKIRRVWNKPFVTGIAYEFQKIDAIAFSSWDIPMNCIITDNNIYLPIKNKGQ